MTTFATSIPDQNACLPPMSFGTAVYRSLKSAKVQRPQRVYPKSERASAATFGRVVTLQTAPNAICLHQVAAANGASANSSLPARTVFDALVRRHPFIKSFDCCGDNTSWPAWVDGNSLKAEGDELDEPRAAPAPSVITTLLVIGINDGVNYQPVARTAKTNAWFNRRGIPSSIDWVLIVGSKASDRIIAQCIQCTSSAWFRPEVLASVGKPSRGGGIILPWGESTKGDSLIV